MSIYTGAPLLHRISQESNPFECLLYEADVAHPPSEAHPGDHPPSETHTGDQLPSSTHHENRLVDHPEYAANMELWLELLRFRKRLHGHKGVRDVWSGMMLRNLDLPVAGPTADALWSNFINTALSDPTFLDSICQHVSHLALDVALPRPSFYRDVVGSALRTVPDRAINCHQRLQHHHLVPGHAAKAVLHHALKSAEPKTAFEAWGYIYTATRASAMYDESMTSVYEFCDFKAAAGWHHFFLDQDDLPTPSMASSPIVRLLTDFSSLTKAHPEQILAAQNQYTALQGDLPTEEHVPVLSRQSMNTLVGDAHGIRQKNIGDAFCARLFATGAFSIDLVISGLRMLGLDKIGSLALREIAVRAQTPQAYMGAIGALQTAGISIADSTYSRIMNEFAKHNDQEYFKVMVQSDQHPDTYDDTALQRKLFSSFLANGDLRQAHTTLTILAMFKSKPNAYISDVMLQEYCKNQDRQNVTRVLAHMREQGLDVSTASLKAILRSFLPPRRRSKVPVAYKNQAQDLDFVGNTFLTLLRSGQKFDQSLWEEILRQYGMTMRLHALERLCLWILACHSSQASSASISLLYSSDNLRQGPSLPEFSVADRSWFLRAIFSRALIRSIIAWGFQSAAPPFRYEQEMPVPFARVAKSIYPQTSEKAHREPDVPKWARGLAFVRLLRDYGVNVPEQTVITEVRTRLLHIFGSRRSSRRRNRYLQDRNTIPLSTYLKQIDEIWGRPLLLVADVPYSDAQASAVLFRRSEADRFPRSLSDGKQWKHGRAWRRG